MSVDVTPAGGTLRPGLPQELFVRRQAGILGVSGRFGYAFIADAKGERFLLSVGPDQETAVAPLTVVVNWAATLLRKP